MAKKPTWPKTIMGESCSPFPGTIWVCRDKETLAKAQAYLQLDGEAIPDANGQYTYLKNSATGETGCLIYVDGELSPIDQVTTLVHELTHAVLCTWDYIGANNPTADQEPFCYFLDSLVKKFLTRMALVPSNDTSLPAQCKALPSET